jgi:hypothetical protein
LRTLKPDEKIIEKEKVVYFEDEDRINDMKEHITDLEAEIGKAIKIELIEK